jgi:hypothetical protein
MKYDLRCILCREPATLETKIKNHGFKRTLGSCGRPHQIRLRNLLNEAEYEYNEEKGRYEK